MAARRVLKERRATGRCATDIRETAGISFHPGFIYITMVLLIYLATSARLDCRNSEEISRYRTCLGPIFRRMSADSLLQKADSTFANIFEYSLFSYLM